MTIQTYIRIRDGSILIDKKEKFFDAIRGLRNGLYTLKAEKVYDNRSSKQNRYYWGVVLPAYVEGIKTEWGEIISQEEAHESLKQQFNFEEKMNENGKSVRIVRSTKGLGTKAFAEYVEHCRNFISEYFNIVTPDPE